MTEMYKHIARVHLAEAKRRRDSGNFYWVLLGWAANARRRATPAQREMF